MAEQLTVFQKWADSVLRLRVEELEQFNAAIQREIERASHEDQIALGLLKLRVNTHYDRMRRARDAQ